MSAGRSLRQIGIVLRKEIRDSLRDRRALWSIVFSMTIGPVLIGFMMNRVAAREHEAESVRIPVVGIENAPALVDWLNQQAGVGVVRGPADAEQAVRDRSEDVVVVVPKDFAERFRQSRPARLQIVVDNSRNDSRPTVERVRRLLAQYGAEIGSLRLITRGISPVGVRPLDVEEVEVSTAQQRAAQILNFIPMFIIMAGFIGGMQIATDSTAGERERGSLEPLLVNPAARFVFVSGKWLAAALAAFVSVLVTTMLCANLPRFLPLEDMDIRFRIGREHLGGIIGAIGPMCLFTAALQASVATLARSFKEAQTYMGVLILFPMIPGIMGALYPIGAAAWMYFVPMLGPYVLLTNVLGGRDPGMAAYINSGIISFITALLLVKVTAMLFSSERIIFAR
jgi:sodium transport system permease protein